MQRKPSRRRRRDVCKIESLEARRLLSVVINEFLANNNTGIMDSDGDRSDWIELRNTGASAVDLNGWSLTDDPASLAKWQFPSTNLSANGFLIVFADSKDRHVAGQELHTNFSLDSAGEYLALVQPDQTTIASSFSPAFPPQLADTSYGITATSNETDALIDEDAPVHVLVPTTAGQLPAGWQNTSFNDASWLAGTIGVGYDTAPTNTADYRTFINTDVGSLMNAPPQASQRNAAFMRLPFQLANKEQLTSLQLQIRYDDGFVAYLNGTEVARRNFNGTPAFNSSASTTHTDSLAIQYESIDISSFLNNLANGNNVLAIAGLNQSGNANDFLIDPLLSANRVNPPVVGYMATPTPGAANNTGTLGFVADTNFSVDRGFFTAPFDVAITSATVGAQIRYTLDGSTPTATTGLVYGAPIHITTTTNLRAAAFKAGYTPTDVDTQTYLFLSDVIHQSAANAQLSATWGHLGPDWEMDPDIVNSPTYSSQILGALQSIPSMSLSLPWEKMFGADGLGIYISGSGVETPVSTEYFSSTGGGAFQENAGIQVQGGSSTNRWKDDKLSLRLKFQAQYGATKLDFPLFNNPAYDQGAATSFDTIVLDGVLNNSWLEPNTTQNQRAMFVQDQVVADLQNQTGGFGPHGTYVHLYIDGMYWGIYYAHERPDDSFAESYLGGDKEDYDVLKHNRTSPVNNSTTAVPDFANFLAAVRQDLTVQSNYNAVANILDIKNFIDYMIVNYYAGNTDWAQHNWYVNYNRVSGSGKWRFSSWDAEHVFEQLGDNVTARNDTGGPTEFNLRLMANPEYKLQFADEVQRLMFNGGPLTPQAIYATYAGRLTQVKQAMIAESAHWGDNQIPSTPYTQANWLAFNGDPSLPFGTPQQTGQLASYFRQRTQTVLNQFIANGWFPALAAPMFNQYGGSISTGFQLTMTQPAGSPIGASIYYTLDGSDPRLTGGTIYPAATVYTTAITLNASKEVKAHIFDGANWSPLIDAKFISDIPFPLRITELNYHPANHAGVTDAEDMEFIELMNTGNATISLQGVTITLAIDPYTFGSGVTLTPGQRIVVAHNRTVFQNIYGTGMNLAPGNYTGKLDNAGEEIKLLGPLTEPLEDFTYDDDLPWPTAADGNGSSLEIIDPLASPNNAANWRASLLAGGSPGTSGLPPNVLSPAFNYLSGQSISFMFNEDMDAASFGVADLSVQLQPGGPILHPNTASLGANKRTATFTFTTPLLGNGNYHATLATTINTINGQTPASSTGLDFFVLAGDVNHDRTVDVGDLGALATNYGLTAGANWSQGDFNYDGKIDVGDLGVLATNYGVTISGGTATAAKIAAPTATIGTATKMSSLPATQAVVTSMPFASTPAKLLENLARTIIDEATRLRHRVRVASK